MKGVGKRIKRLREDRGLKQYAFAREILATPSAVSAWERDISEPSYDTLVAIARYFGVSTDYLLGLSERKEG